MALPELARDRVDAVRSSLWPLFVNSSLLTACGALLGTGLAHRLPDTGDQRVVGSFEMSQRLRVAALRAAIVDATLRAWGVPLGGRLRFLAASPGPPLKNFLRSVLVQAPDQIWHGKCIDRR